MEITNRLDVFEPGDQTALVSIDVPEAQRLVVEQLSALGYKMHTGLFTEDVLLKMRTHLYDVVLIAEHFNGTDIETNPILAEATHLNSIQRRKQVVVIIGSSLNTDDENEAFQHSVDLVVNLSDIVNLRPVLRRAVLRKQEFYVPFNDSMRAVGAA
jgi:CheY-like chemotaxis protein